MGEKWRGIPGVRGSDFQLVVDIGDGIVALVGGPDGPLCGGNDFGVDFGAFF